MSFRRVISALLLVAYLPACTSFQATTQPLSELTAPPKPAETVRITTSDGKQRDVDAPRVVNDTLYGSTWITGPGGQQRAGAMAIPVADIRTVEVKRGDGTKTLLLVGGIIGGIVILGVAGCDGEGWGC